MTPDKSKALLERLTADSESHRYLSFEDYVDLLLIARKSLDAEDRIAELKGALKPFADAANDLRFNKSDKTAIYLGKKYRDTGQFAITYGHLRKAKALLGGEEG